MKKLLSIAIALIVSLALITPAAALPAIVIDSAVIVRRTVTITGTVAPCPNYATVSVQNVSSRVNITVTPTPDPLAGVCPDNTPPAPFEKVVTLTLNKPKAVYVNGVLIGTMR